MIPINTQPIEKRQVSNGSILDVHSVFYTIQGEGPFTGHPAVFVRLAGCNLRCPSCDTDYTSVRDQLTIKEVLVAVNMHYTGTGPNKLVVITGGEPFRQDLGFLIQDLNGQDFHVQIETNGTLPAPLHIDDYDCTIVCSPKAGKIHPEIGYYADAFKYVLSADSVDLEDGLPTLALNHTASPRVARPPEEFDGPIYLQPMDPGPTETVQYSRNVQACIESCMKHGYILQLQTHKIIGVD